ncbi:hypothetical protein [Algicola sagamiensis]|uniref:hypothetical protein n=1 Tax=Algicola sagamiensis TaxID=163869 RepID=UPI00036453F6|nr:hypothetical protein [Algicola sagamiensis]
MFTKQTKALFLMAPVALAIVGCSDEETSTADVKDSAYWADIQVNSNGDKNSSTVKADLKVSGPTGNSLKLQKGEKIEVRAGGLSKELKYDKDFLGSDYETAIGIDETGTEFDVRFYPLGKKPFISTVKMPEKYAISAPKQGAVFKSNEMVQVLWDKPTQKSTRFKLDATYQCTPKDGQTKFSYVYDLSKDTGSYTFDLAKAEQLKASDIDRSKPCYLEAVLKRTNTGELSKEYGKGGKIEAHQTRKVKVQINF